MAYQPTDPKLSWLRNLFILRRTLRLRAAAQDQMLHVTRALEKKAKRLETKSPSNGHVAQGVRDKANSVRAEFHARHPASLKDYGKLIMDMAIWVDHVTTLQERCEALNVNIADRAELKEKDGIIEIIFGHGLEDSATHRHSDHNWDKPLFQALVPAFIDFMNSTPETRAAADQALEDVFGFAFPIPGERPLDTPSPSIHDLYGQRATERKPTLH